MFSAVNQPKSPHALLSVGTTRQSDTGLKVSLVRTVKVTPKTAMRISIETSIIGAQRPTTGSFSKKRTKVQNFYGQVVTEESAMKALEEKEKKRRDRKHDSLKRAGEKKFRKTPKKAKLSFPKMPTVDDPDSIEEKCCLCCSDQDPPWSGKEKKSVVFWNRCNCNRWYHEFCQKQKHVFCPVCQIKGF